jgi:hypothetical protein
MFETVQIDKKDKPTIVIPQFSMEPPIEICSEKYLFTISFN